MGLLDKFPSWAKTQGKGITKHKFVGGGIREQIEKSNVYDYGKLSISNDKYIKVNNSEYEYPTNIIEDDIIHIKPSLLSNVDKLCDIIQNSVGIIPDMEPLFNEEFTVNSICNYYLYVKENEYAWPIEIFDKGKKRFVNITNSLLQCIDCGTTYLISESHDCDKSEEIQSEI